MRKSKYSEEQLIDVLKRAEQGVAVKDIGREAKVLRRLRQLETMSDGERAIPAASRDVSVSPVNRQGGCSVRHNSNRWLHLK